MTVTRSTRAPGPAGPPTATSTVAIAPSWAASAQHPALWFDTKFPNPNSTQVPFTRSTGWGTCAWWPTTRSTTPAAVTASATSRCWAFGSATYSVPQCRLTTTTSAPSSRTRWASATIRAGSISRTDQGASAGTGMPFVPYV